MAVNVYKDSTFNRVHSDWWDGSETPQEISAMLKTKDGKEHGAKAIVLEIDSGTWYNYLQDNSGTNQAWYDSDGATK